MYFQKEAEFDGLKMKAAGSFMFFPKDFRSRSWENPAEKKRKEKSAKSRMMCKNVDRQVQCQY